MGFRVGEQNKTINIYFVDDEDDGIDISAAITTKEFIFRKPNGTETTVNASFISSGTGGGLTYTVTSSSFFDVAGIWRVQAIVTVSGTIWKTAIGQFEVEPNL
jgi:hypothetical protein